MDLEPVADLSEGEGAGPAEGQESEGLEAAEDQAVWFEGGVDPLQEDLVGRVIEVAADIRSAAIQPCASQLRRASAIGSKESGTPTV